VGVVLAPEPALHSLWSQNQQRLSEELTRTYHDQHAYGE
jgi:hypothetical protein